MDMRWSIPVAVILEFVPTDKFFNHNGEFLPFLAANARKCGLEVKYLCFGYDPWSMPENPFLVELSSEELLLLESRLSGRQPAYIVSNQELGQGVKALLDKVAPRVRVIPGRAAELFAHPELRELVGIEEGRLLDPELLPDFSCELCNSMAREIKPVISILGGANCLYAGAVRDNPVYADSGLGSVLEHRGCAFCRRSAGMPNLDKATSISFAVGQIRQVLETMPGDKQSHNYLLDNAVLFHEFDAFLDQVLELSLPPAVFLVSCRVDEFLRKLPMIEGILPRLAAAGHKLAIQNMGVENFSAEENLRLNKNISLEQVARIVATMDRLEGEFPGAFSFREFGGFGFILFTPWTTIRDLRLNLEAAQRFGIEATSHLFTSRLILLKGTPITELATRDGLLDQRFNFSRGRIFGGEEVMYSPTDSELPWRFQDPRIGVVYSILYRMMPSRSSFEGDPDLPLVQDLLARLPEEEREVYHFLPKVLDILEEHPEFLEVEQVIDAFRSRHGLGVDLFKEEDAVSGLVQALTARGLALPEGFRFSGPVSGLEGISGHGLVFVRDDERLVVALERLEPGSAYFFKGRILGLCHHKDTPPSREHGAPFIRYLVSALELRSEKNELLEPGAPATSEVPKAGDPRISALESAVEFVAGSSEPMVLQAEVSQRTPLEVQAHLTLESGPLILLFSLADEKSRYFYRNRLVGVSHAGATPADSPARQALMKTMADRIAALLEL